MIGLGRDPLEQFRKDVNRALAERDRRIQQLENHLVQVSRAMSASKSRDSGEVWRQHNMHYGNTILLLGYGGFFALWSSTAGDMPKGWFGLAGALMGLSLLLFLLFELAKTALSSHSATTGGGMSGATRMLDRLDQYWQYIFGITAVLGLAAGMIVLVFFGSHALSSKYALERPAAPVAVPTKAHQRPDAPSHAAPASTK